MDVKLLEEQYRDYLSDFHDWDQLNHANDWILFEQNPGTYKGKAKFEMKDYRGAISDFTKVIGIDPKNSSVIVSRGIEYFYLFNYDSEIGDLTNAIEIEP